MFFVMLYLIFIHLKYFRPYFSTLSTLFFDLIDLISTLSTLSTLKKLKTRNFGNFQAIWFTSNSTFAQKTISTLSTKTCPTYQCSKIRIKIRDQGYILSRLPAINRFYPGVGIKYFKYFRRALGEFGILGDKQQIFENRKLASLNSIIQIYVFLHLLVIFQASRYYLDYEKLNLKMT